MLAAKPLPVTVTQKPAYALVGLKVMLPVVVAAVVTVKVAEACADTPIGKPASIEYVPSDTEETSRAIEKVPVDDVVTY